MTKDNCELFEDISCGKVMFSFKLEAGVVTSVTVWNSEDSRESESVVTFSGMDVERFFFLATAVSERR